METVALTFEYTKTEYVKAERRYLLASKTIRRYDVALCGIFLAFALFYLFYSSFSAISIAFSVLLAVVTGIGCFIYFYAPALRFKRAEKHREPYAVVFTESTIFWKTPTIDTQTKWEAYTEIWRSADFYFLLRTKYAFAPIPRRAFKDADAEALFERFAAANGKQIRQI